MREVSCSDCNYKWPYEADAKKYLHCPICGCPVRRHVEIEEIKQEPQFSTQYNNTPYFGFSSPKRSREEMIRAAAAFNYFWTATS